MAPELEESIKQYARERTEEMINAQIGQIEANRKNVEALHAQANEILEMLEDVKVQIGGYSRTVNTLTNSISNIVAQVSALRIQIYTAGGQTAMGPTDGDNG